MGRPLNKKYFGNRNIGSTSTTADNGIGGGFLASVSNGTVGAIQINNTYKTFPDLTVAAPLLPGGVTADLTVTWEVATVSLAGGSSYTAGTITSITGLDGFADTDTRFTVTVSGGVPTFDAFTERGSYTNIDGTGITTWAVVGPGGTGAQATVTFRVKSISVTEQGSGYTVTPALSWSAVNGGTMPSAQSVTMGTDTGSAGSVTNDENAIIVTAFIPTANGGSSAVIGDIVKQTNDRRYKVKTAQGTGICQLVTDGVANAAGEVSIKATDSDGGNYLVAKLTSRKVVLVPAALGGSAGTQFASGASAKWSFTTTIEDAQVVIENA